jgi:3-hydroxybutyryl-CoA dehydrogenase
MDGVDGVDALDGRDGDGRDGAGRDGAGDGEGARGGAGDRPEGQAGLAVERPVAVVGCGTMGRGIAQVALAAGHPVLLFDTAAGQAEAAVGAIHDRLDRQVAKGRLTAEERAAAGARLGVASGLAELAPAGLVIEAVVEDLAVKRELFAGIEDVVGEDCLLATNTSSLPVTAIAAGLRRPGRFVGLHFFNPAPVLPLVEVVSGAATDTACAALAHATARAWGKSPVRCADTPGFVVNRVARPFYAEAFRLYEERAADPATIDAVLRGSGGFAMGPFELTDLIGQDVNEAVTRSVWTAFHHDPRFTPSLAQRQLVQSGRLGRKTGHGWYDHGGELPAARTAAPAKAPEAVTSVGGLGPATELGTLVEEAGIPLTRLPGDGGPDRLELPGGTVLRLTDGLPATRAGSGPLVLFDLALDYRAADRVALAVSDTAPPGTTEEAVGLFQALGKQVSVVDDAPGLIVARTVAMLVNIATDAVARGVACAEDVDTAMRLGVNYPLGPVAWGQRLGAGWVWEVLEGLESVYRTGRYTPCPLLLRQAAAGMAHVVPGIAPQGGGRDE